MGVPQKLPQDLVIALLGTYQKEMKSVYPKDICPPMFIAALFTVAKIWEQAKVLVCPVTGGLLHLYPFPIQGGFIQCRGNIYTPMPPNYTSCLQLFSEL